uniref:LuxR family transcriptional regulator n=1 Tax=Sorangium cellulosum TaxID=56 RepID=A0A0M3STZ6_SORCE|nr:LuxR family transcriptional regulator [Sorangium cellulosum]
MKVSGTTILTRKTLVSRRFGSEAWRGLFRDVALANPWFRRPITASSLVPLPEFLAFHDELVRRFYPDGKDALFELGAESARWALVDGPLNRFVQDAEISSLVATVQNLWYRYFAETDSRSEAILSDAGVEFRVRDLPAWHPYLEHFVIGYTKEVLELYCANPIWTHRLTEGRGTAYGYLLTTDPVPRAPPSLKHTGAGHGPLVRPRRALTARELEVLRLVGAGKTNREIACVLRISEKTVQHHVAHAYDKLGVYSRAGATLWLAERGLLALPPAP